MRMRDSDRGKGTTGPDHGSFRGHCVKRDGSAESAYACTADVRKFWDSGVREKYEWGCCIFSEHATAPRGLGIS